MGEEAVVRGFTPLEKNIINNRSVASKKYRIILIEKNKESHSVYEI